MWIDTNANVQRDQRLPRCLYPPPVPGWPPAGWLRPSGAAGATPVTDDLRSLNDDLPEAPADQRKLTDLPVPFVGSLDPIRLPIGAASRPPTPAQPSPMAARPSSKVLARQFSAREPIRLRCTWRKAEQHATTAENEAAADGRLPGAFRAFRLARRVRGIVAWAAMIESSHHPASPRPHSELLFLR